MPELPEVETTLRGVAPYLLGHRVVAVTVRERRLRWPVPEAVEHLAGATIETAGCGGVSRRFAGPVMTRLRNTATSTATTPTASQQERQS
jgi:hypothetical protein